MARGPRWAARIKPPHRVEKVKGCVLAAWERAIVGMSVSSDTGREDVEAVLAAKACGSGVSTILWIIAAVLVIAGIVTLVRGGVLAGVVLIIVGLLIGPGGVSIFC
jgi:hypothetical protein